MFNSDSIAKEPMVIDAELSGRIKSVSFVCACLVVSIHVVCLCEPGTVGWWLTHLFLPGGITRACVPLFFVISGFLLAGKMVGSGWWWPSTRKRLRTLLIPYLLWNLLYWLFELTLASLAAQFGQTFGRETWNDATWSSLFRVLGVDIFKPPELSLLWYVRCLILYVLISPLLLIFRHKSGWLGLIALWCVYLFVPEFIPVEGSGWQAGFYKEGLFQGLFFFSLGIYLRWNPVVLKKCRMFGICTFIIGVVIQLAVLGAVVENNSLMQGSIFFLMAGLWFLIPVISVYNFGGGGCLLQFMYFIHL